MACLEVKNWAHLVAIGGTGMGALAALLQDKGYYVTGTDGPLYPPMSHFLESRKIPIQPTYQIENLKGISWNLSKAQPDLIVIGNAISRGNPEALAAESLLQKGLSRRMSFAEALAEFCIEDKKSFVVVGTHGKTTTTSLMAWILEKLSLKPGFFIGGIPKNFSQGYRRGEGRHFVSEGDEYDTAYWDKKSKFLHYKADWVLCTGIEWDHVDIFSSLEAVENAFLELVLKTKKAWLLIDDFSAPSKKSVQKVARALQDRSLLCLRYGKDPKSDYCLVKAQASKLPWDNQKVGTLFVFRNPKGDIVQGYSPLIGEHNALNLLGVFATLHASGEMKDWTLGASLISDFLGIKRRQEEVFQNDQLIVIDDFAHHPTAIRETLGAIRDRYPGFELAAFFEPRSATSSRNVLIHEMESCFDKADAVFLSLPTKTNIPESEKLDVQELAHTLKTRRALQGKTVEVASKASLLAELFENWRQKQNRKVLALVMSNGPFDGIHSLLSRPFSQ